ncbi:MAG: GyrI-like domain-containing protein [Clostridiaceae bacterium]|nr:GyrI-like domain-containing protein [Clostridiaceae bacterium]
MSRISELRLKQTPACYTVSVRKTINFMEGYAAFFGEALSRIDAHLGACGALTSSPAMACFHNMDLEHLDVEVGYHLAQKVPCEGGVTCQSCPSRKIVTAIDMGLYEQQDATLMDLFGFIEANHLEMQGSICYYYVNEPDRPESEYLTQMVIPVKQPPITKEETL